MIRMKNVSKTYNLSNKQIVALKDVNLKINKADYVSIVGSSGSGKSTLLAILAFLPTIKVNIILMVLMSRKQIVNRDSRLYLKLG